MAWNKYDEEHDETQDGQETHPARDAERSPRPFHDVRQDYKENERGVHLSLAQRANAPIGVFDSGAGGLTILSALRQELPDEDYIYIGDTAHVPYGTRSDEEIIDFSLQACRFLMARGVKLIVIACNTASQAALSVLRATLPIPFVGVVPAVKPATRATRNGRIGIAATNHAVNASYLHHLIEDFATGVQVYTTGCPELVTLVEHGLLDGPLVEETLQHSLSPLLLKQVDVIVLGCTHFPALRHAIERVAGKQVQVIDSGVAVARRVHAVLDAESAVHPVLTSASSGITGMLEVWCTGEPQAFRAVASKVLGYPVEVSQTRFEE
jgi:glutamate racemase